MSGFLDTVRRAVISSVWKEEADAPEGVSLDDKIALGVLLWIVAHADKNFLPQEHVEIERVLTEFGKIPPKEIPVVLAAVEQADAQRIDMYAFTREVSSGLPYDVKCRIVENLFRVACSDNDLAHEEHEVIRKISSLLGVDHKDFINAKITIKKEYGMETVGE